MKVKKLTIKKGGFLEKLHNIPDPPKSLFVLSSNLEQLFGLPSVAIVGSRKASAYGRTVTTQLTTELAARGVVVVSGLALGVDSIAHSAAVGAGAKTIAVLPCGLDRIYPATHTQLARDILKTGGALISEYPEGTFPYKPHFIERNRLIAGLADAVLIPEAATKSGSLHTAEFALEQGKAVLAVPGNITSETSQGTNSLIKAGATPVTSVEDILYALDIPATAIPRQLPLADTKEQQAILELLQQGYNDGAELLALTNIEPALFNQSLTLLEINGYIRAVGGNRWMLS